MSNPIGVPGRGSQLLYSTDNVNFTPVAQLQSFAPSGSKHQDVDQTNLLTPGVYGQHLPVLIDPGTVDLSGILNPQDLSYRALQHLHHSRQLVYWRVLLIDGTPYGFQAYVSEFLPFVAKWNKLHTWTAKLKLTTGMTGPECAFQPDAFDSDAYQIF